MKSHNSYYYARREHHRAHEESALVVLTVILLGTIGLIAYVLVKSLGVRAYQIIEGGFYLLCATAASAAVLRYFLTRNERRERAWPHPAIYVPVLKDARHVQEASNRNAVVLG